MQKDYFANRQVTTDNNVGYFILPKGFFSYRSRSDTDLFVFNRNDIIEKGIISYYYPVFHVTKCDSDFFLRRVNFGIQQQLSKAAEGTGQRVLAHSNFKKILALYPTLLEQIKIGAYFSRLDVLIALHQRKHEKLVTLKKAMLKKMFPAPGATTPEIRFKDFSEPWEEKKLGDEVIITMGQSPSGANYTNNPADFVLVQGNADMKNGYVTPRVWTTQVTKTANAGDLILSVRAPVGEVGKTEYDVVLGRGVAGIKGNEFIFQSLSRMNELGYWTQFSSGSTFDSINSEDLREAVLVIPSKDEQQKIGTYFRQLDELIAQHGTQVEKLKQIKTACLEKMFV